MVAKVVFGLLMCPGQQSWPTDRRFVAFLLRMLAINHIIACLWYGIGYWTGKGGRERESERER